MATLSYDASAKLAKDLDFKGRIAVACLHFAKYITDEPNNAPAHTTRYKWAQGCFQNPDIIASQIQHTVVQQDQVQADGANVSDPDLQTATETALQQFI